MNRDDMIVSHVFNEELLKIGDFYRFKCGDTTQNGILTDISQNTLVFCVPRITQNNYKCTLESQELTAQDFYSDEDAYIKELSCDCDSAYVF